jgi:hypothetical protein
MTANRQGAGDIWAYMQPCHAARSWSLCRLARAATTPIPGTNLRPRYSRPQSPTINITPSPLARAPNLSFKTCPLSVFATLGDTRAPPRPNAGLQILTDTWSMGLHNMLLTTSRPTPCPLLASPSFSPFHSNLHLMSDGSKFPRRLPVVLVPRARDLLVQPTPLRTVQQH